ncbi:MAG: LysR family transcriptional regulator [Clostridia bacterium]|nr:LysR family transcriptional regulator [Clostridia bacterium]
MYRQMRYFIAVVEKNSFFEAGELCHISQSAISQQIKALENELQVQLLERHGRTFTVTPAGRYFYEQAKKMTQMQESVVREVRRIESGEYQRLRVGVLNGFSTRIIRETVRDFTGSHPHVRLYLTTGTHEELFHPVNSGSLDMVINDQWRALSDQYVNEELMEQPLFALLRQDDPLASEDRISLNALQERMCILVAPAEQRETETSHWRDVMGLQSSFLFAENVDEACLNAAAGNGFYPCDADMTAEGGTVKIPLFRDGKPLIRKMFAFWPESSDSSLQWEFTETLCHNLK